MVFDKGVNEWRRCELSMSFFYLELSFTFIFNFCIVWLLCLCIAWRDDKCNANLKPKPRQHYGSFSYSRWTYVGSPHRMTKAFVTCFNSIFSVGWLYNPGSGFAYNLSMVEYADFCCSVELGVLLQLTFLLALLCYSALFAVVLFVSSGTVVWPSVANLGFWRFAQSDIVIVLCTISINSVLLRAISKPPLSSEWNQEEAARSNRKGLEKVICL